MISGRGWRGLPARNFFPSEARTSATRDRLNFGSRLIDIAKLPSSQFFALL